MGPIRLTPFFEKLAKYPRLIWISDLPDFESEGRTFATKVRPERKIGLGRGVMSKSGHYRGRQPRCTPVIPHLDTTNAPVLFYHRDGTSESIDSIDRIALFH